MISMKNVDAERFTAGIAEFVERAVKPLAARVRALEADNERLKQLEARVQESEARGIGYEGVWQRAQSYRRGNLCTHRGSLWIALRATDDEPGKSNAWQLGAKGAV